MQAAEGTFFARWRVTMAAFVAQGLGPGLFSAYGLFVDPLSTAFEAPHASLALGMSMLLVMQALLGPLLGPLLDRHSIRNIMLAGSALATAGLFSAAQASGIWMLFGGYLVAVFGITLYAPLPAVVLVSSHYDVLRGRALSLAAVGTSAAGILLPLGIAQLLGRFDWRVALLSLTALVGTLSFVAFLVCIPAQRRARRSVLSEVDPNAIAKPQPTRWAFMRNRAFWIIGLTFSVLLGMSGFYAFSLAPHVREVGLSVENAATIMATGAFVSFGSKVGFASIADRVKSHLIGVTVGLIAVQGIAWLLIMTSESLPGFMLAGALYGTTMGPFLMLGPYLNSLYFEEAIIGRVNGSQAPLVLPFALSAPPLAGLSYDLTGSYVAAFQGAIAMLAVLGTLFLFLGQPTRPIDSSPD